MDPEQIRAYKEQAKSMRVALLCDEDFDDGSVEGCAVQHIFLAMSALEQAERFFELAALEQTRALAAGRLGR